MSTLFCFGLGYTAMALGRRMNTTQGWRVSGTCRKPARRAALGALGIEAALFDGSAPMDRPELLRDATHVLLSIPPDAEGDPAYRHHAADLAKAERLEWVGYLSTTGVYGDRAGGWVDETSELLATSDRSRRRIEAEAKWLDWGTETGIPVQLFRLAGIYGPGRSAADQVKAGTAKRIDKPDHLFSRIHVEDAATVLAASIARPRAGGIYNVCDDEPAAPADVVAYVCELLGIEPPPLVPFEAAWEEMSPMARSFWADDRRVRNGRIRDELGVALAYPDYRIGLRAVLGLA
jgi:nucleoside-diphosphate-sugar epimerase